MEQKYDLCPECGAEMYPVGKMIKEKKMLVTQSGVCFYETGKEAKIIDYLLCDRCGHQTLVDDYFDYDL